MGNGQTTPAVEPAEWNGPGGEAARAIRFEVFVDEQKVPADEEIDAVDPSAWHVVAWMAGDTDGPREPAATGRLYGDAADPALCHIGRMAVRAPWRGAGAGRAVMEALMAEARRRGFRRATLGAQCHALGFYGRFGFVARGPVYDDCGIDHREMVAEL